MVEQKQQLRRSLLDWLCACYLLKGWRKNSMASALQQPGRGQSECLGSLHGPALTCLSLHTSCSGSDEDKCQHIHTNHALYKARCTSALSILSCRSSSPRSMDFRCSVWSCECACIHSRFHSRRLSRGPSQKALVTIKIVTELDNCQGAKASASHLCHC